MLHTLSGIITLPPGDVRLRYSQHVQRRFVELHEHPIVDLEKTQQLQNFAWLGVKAVDTERNKGEKLLKVTEHK